MSDDVPKTPKKRKEKKRRRMVLRLQISSDVSTYLHCPTTTRTILN